jgi:predicted RNase H-like HicB family nuclease/uncharacterized protein (DUF433 family)
MIRTLTAVIRKEDENWYVADCLETGTASQGKTIEEALANLKEAVELYAREFPFQESIHPLVTTFDAALPESAETKARERSAEYVAEEENTSNLDWAFPNIEIIEGIGGSSAVIRGTKIHVRILVGYFLIGVTPEVIVRETLPHLTLAQVYEAMRYYFVHRAEIDKEREESSEEASRRMLLEKLGEKKYREITGDSLSAEIKAWELASDEALENFEKGLNQ